MKKGSTVALIGFMSLTFSAEIFARGCKLDYRRTIAQLTQAKRNHRVRPYGLGAASIAVGLSYCLGPIIAAPVVALNCWNLHSYVGEGIDRCLNSLGITHPHFPEGEQDLEIVPDLLDEVDWLSRFPSYKSELDRTSEFFPTPVFDLLVNSYVRLRSEVPLSDESIEEFRTRFDPALADLLFVANEQRLLCDSHVHGFKEILKELLDGTLSRELGRPEFEISSP